MKLITAKGVNKFYKDRIPASSPLEYMTSLFQPKYNQLHAVKDLNMELQAGECLGFIGPNGAGKSTFIKLLCGIQTPSSGDLTVLGHKPSYRESTFFKKIGVVFGHKTSLWWDLPLSKSLEMSRLIYKVPEQLFKNNFEQIVNGLGLKDVLHRPVRILSLGERVKGELAMNLLFGPKLLFLDEPTIGLDIQSKAEIRRLLNQYRKETGLGIFLTSHDMGDIEACCDRVIMVDQGAIIYEGNVEKVRSAFNQHIKVAFEVKENADYTFDSLLTLLQSQAAPSSRLDVDAEKGIVTIQTAKGTEGAVISKVTQTFDVNINVHHPSLEEIMVSHFKNLRDHQ